MSTHQESTTAPSRGGAKRLRNAAVSIAATGAAAAGLILAAPSAQATVWDINVERSPGLFTSAQNGTGCTYTITMNVTPGDWVDFGDTQPATFNPPSPVLATADTVQVEWTPHGAAWHTIWAWQGAATPTATEGVEVAVGHNLGSSCLVLPF